MKDQNSVLNSDEITFEDIVIRGKFFLGYLLRKWKLLVLVGLLGGLMGVLFAYFQKPKYTAELTFALEDEKSTGMGLSSALGIASSLGLDIGGGAGSIFTGANVIELLKSRKIIELALLKKVTYKGTETSLAEVYIEFNNLRRGWDKKIGNVDLNQILRFSPDTERSKYTLQQDSVLGIIYKQVLKNNLIVSQKDKKVAIVTIEVKSLNEFFSKTLAEVLVNEVSEFYIETKIKKSKNNVNILSYQADSIRKELYCSITGVAFENDNVYNLNPAMNIKRIPSSKRQIDVQANTAILTQLVTNLELARVALRKETPLIQIIDQPILPLKKDKLSKLKSLVIGGLIFNFIYIIFLGVRMNKNFKN